MFIVLVIVLISLSAVLSQRIELKPGSVFDPTNTRTNTSHFVVSNLINGDWSGGSPGWNPLPNINIYNTFYAQFGWSNQQTGGFNYSNMLVTGFVMSYAGDLTHTPSRVGVIPNGGSSVSQAIQSWDIQAPNPGVHDLRLNRTFMFDTPQALNSFTVYFYNSNTVYQVYIYQIGFIGYAGLSPIAVTDMDNYPTADGLPVTNLVRPNTLVWNPLISILPPINNYFFTTFTLPQLNYTIAGFQIWTSLDNTHTFSRVGLMIGADNNTANAVQNFNLAASQVREDGSGRPNGWAQGWASFTLSTPVTISGSQVTLYYYNGNSIYQVYMMGVRFYTSDKGSGNTTCAAGYFSNRSVCQACMAGTFSLAGSTSCTSCPAGSSSSSGSASCNICPAGTRSPPGSPSCLVCPAGRMSPANSSTCTDCAAGSFSSTGSASCSICSAGTFSSVASAWCTRCLPGSVSPSNSSSCSGCPANTFSSYDGSSCVSCPINQYSFPNSTFCTSCPSGSYVVPGTFTCSPCPSGWALLSNTSSCSLCPSDTFSVTGGQNCFPCPAGSFSAPGSGTCSINSTNGSSCTPSSHEPAQPSNTGLATSTKTDITWSLVVGILVGLVIAGLFRAAEYFTAMYRSRRAESSVDKFVVMKPMNEPTMCELPSISASDVSRAEGEASVC